MPPPTHEEWICSLKKERANAVRHRRKYRERTMLWASWQATINNYDRAISALRQIDISFAMRPTLRNEP